MRPTRWSHDFLFYWILWILKLEYKECCFCTCTPYPSLYWTLWMCVRNTKVSYKRKRYNFPPFVLRYSFFLFLVFLENKSRNIGLLWNIVNTNARFYVGSRSFATIQTISAINMSTIFTNQFDTSTFKLATEFTIFSSSTTTRVIIKHQHFDCLEPLSIVYLVVADL